MALRVDCCACFGSTQTAYTPALRSGKSSRGLSCSAQVMTRSEYRDYDKHLLTCTLVIRMSVLGGGFLAKLSEPLLSHQPTHSVSLGDTTSPYLTLYLNYRSSLARCQRLHTKRQQSQKSTARSSDRPSSWCFASANTQSPKDDEIDGAFPATEHGFEEYTRSLVLALDSCLLPIPLLRRRGCVSVRPSRREAA